MDAGAVVVNLVYRPVAGLEVNAQMIREALIGRGFVVVDRHAAQYTLPERARRWFRRRMPAMRPAALNCFLEEIFPDWLPHARRNVLVPNQEWCRAGTFDRLSVLDALWCKTHYAASVFAPHYAGPIRYTGFSSPDRHDAGIARDYSRCLHVAGRSQQKGTETLLRVWQRHPDWPVLTVVSQNPELGLGISAPNIVRLGFVADNELRFLQNVCGIHLCPSEAEGFGHYLVEAMGCGAVVLTTDAPPMNELVADGRGVCVAYAGTRPQSLGVNFYVERGGAGRCHRSCPRAVRR